MEIKYVMFIALKITQDMYTRSMKSWDILVFCLPQSTFWPEMFHACPKCKLDLLPLKASETPSYYIMNSKPKNLI